MRSVSLLAIVVVIAVTSCKSTGSAPKRDAVPSPDYSMRDVPPPPPKDSHFAEVKKSAAEQLSCPIEQVNIICLRRDADGECVAIKADGCDKSFEYDFGN